MNKSIKEKIREIINDSESWQPDMIIETSAEGILWRFSHKWLKEKTNLISKLLDQVIEEIIDEIREYENPFEPIRKQANLQFHAAECMKYGILGLIEAKLKAYLKEVKK